MNDIWNDKNILDSRKGIISKGYLNVILTQSPPFQDGKIVTVAAAAARQTFNLHLINFYARQNQLQDIDRIMQIWTHK